MSLEAKISTEFMREFTTCLDVMRIFGDELRIEVRETQLILWTVNSSLTGQAVIRLAPTNFESYELQLPDGMGETETLDSINCGVEVKTLRRIIRADNPVSDPLSWCMMYLVDMTAYRQEIAPEECLNPALTLDLVWVNDITKTHVLALIESEPLKLIYDKVERYSFSVDPHMLEDYLKLFSSNVLEIVFQCSPNSIRLGSHWDVIDEALNSLERPLDTQVEITVAHWTQYNIPENVQVIVQAKELRAAVTFAADMDLQLRACFDGPGW
ncbi:Rad9/Ddc1 [Spinellus fusiger]|nr:Rad9/Ddc1 [Spinellus fusiger]